MHHSRTLASRQRGLSMIGFLIVVILLGFMAMLATKLIPAYVEFYTVEKILNTMSQKSDVVSGSNAEIRADFMKRASVGDITTVKPEDLSINRRGAVTVLSADYEFRAALFGNISLVADFSASSDSNAAAEVE